jgi:hypothetical protein
MHPSNASRPCSPIGAAPLLLWLLVLLSIVPATILVAAEDGDGGDSAVAGAADGDAAPEEDSEDEEYRTLWMAHGLLMAISWAILLPIGIGCSFLRTMVAKCGKSSTWFVIHRLTNGLAFLLMTAAFGIAVYVTQQLGDPHFEVGDNNHKAVGLAIYVISFAQVMAGIFRPHLPSPGSAPEDAIDKTAAPGTDGEESNELEPQVRKQKQFGEETAEAEALPNKSFGRRVFEWGHRVVGFALLGLAWYNCSVGIEIMEEDYGPSYDKTSALWGVVGGLGGLILVLYAYQWFATKKAAQ